MANLVILGSDELQPLFGAGTINLIAGELCSVVSAVLLHKQA